LTLAKPSRDVSFGFFWKKKQILFELRAPTAAYSTRRWHWRKMKMSRERHGPTKTFSHRQATRRPFSAARASGGEASDVRGRYIGLDPPLRARSRLNVVAGSAYRTNLFWSTDFLLIWRCSGIFPGRLLETATAEPYSKYAPHRTAANPRHSEPRLAQSPHGSIRT
jgi:hypothetical protein